MEYGLFSFFESLQLEWYKHVNMEYFHYTVNGKIIQAHKK